MNAIQQQKDYYEKYWTTGHAQYSGDKQGYATNLRNWMRAQLREVAGDAAILEPGSYAPVEPQESYALGPRSLAVLISARPR